MAQHSVEPRSRRERPAKPALTKPGIIAAAVAVMRAEGLERVTMRRLAQELDTGPASLYVYVRNTAELHAAILDELLGAVDLTPAQANDDWRDRLIRVLTSYIDVLFEHPSLAHSALVARPSGEHYLDLVETLLALLDEGGVSHGTAAWGIDLLLQVATATAAEQSARERDIGAQDDWDALTAALSGASAERHPHLAALSADLVSGTGPSRLEWTFRMVIDALPSTTPPTPDQAAPAPPTPTQAAPPHSGGSRPADQPTSRD